MKIVRGNAIDFVPASHESASDPGVLKKVLASQADLQEGQIKMLNWSLLKAGKSFQTHFHEDMQEVFVILSGTVEIVVAKTVANLLAGDCVIIDPQEPHAMSNKGESDAVFLAFGIANGEDGKTVIV